MKNKELFFQKLTQRLSHFSSLHCRIPLRYRVRFQVLAGSQKHHFLEDTKQNLPGVSELNVFQGQLKFVKRLSTMVFKALIGQLATTKNICHCVTLSVCFTCFKVSLELLSLVKNVRNLANGQEKRTRCDVPQQVSRSL